MGDVEDRGHELLEYLKHGFTYKEVGEFFDTDEFTVARLATEYLNGEYSEQLPPVS